MIPPPARLGNDVVIAKNLKKAFGDRLLFENMNFSLPRGGIVGIIGPNGAGKTTLFKMITGKEKSDGGELKIGETVQLAYVDQTRTLNNENNAWQEISGGNEIDRSSARRRSTAARISRASTSAAPTSRRKSATSRAASATGCISRRR